MSRGRSSAIISPGSTARSWCWSTRWPRSIRAPRRSRDLQQALSEVLEAFRAGRASLLSNDVSSADRSHPLCGDQGRPPPSCQPRPARRIFCALLTARAIERAQGVGRLDRCDRHRGTRATCEAQIRSRAARRSMRSSAFPNRARGSTARHFRRPQRGRDLSRPIAGRSERDFRGRRDRAARSRQRLAVRPLPPAPQPSAASRAPQIRLDRALQFLIGDRSDAIERIQRYRRRVPRAFRLDDRPRGRGRRSARVP